MKTIQLSRGQVALVDDEDYEWLNQWKWWVRPSRNGIYAVRAVSIGRTRQINYFMHRAILGIIDVKTHIDHINGNGLDNRKCNLRILEKSGYNQRNMAKTKPHTSIYKGVYWHKGTKKWKAKIMLDYKSYHIGYYKIETEAAMAYDKKAKELFGKYARLNNALEACYG